jgi:hypothetical protein
LCSVPSSMHMLRMPNANQVSRLARDFGMVLPSPWNRSKWCYPSHPDGHIPYLCMQPMGAWMHMPPCHLVRASWTQRHACERPRSHDKRNSPVRKFSSGYSSRSGRNRSCMNSDHWRSARIADCLRSSRIYHQPASR